MSVTIRRAQAEDLDDLLALYAELNPADPPVDAVLAARSWAQILASEMIGVHVAEAEGRVVATCTIVIVPNLTRGARPYAMIENVVTAAHARGQGLARRVIEAAAAQAWAADCYKVMLMTGRSDPAVHRFYEGCGFRRGKTAFELRAQPRT